MPSLRGTVHDAARKRSFTIEVEGSPATNYIIWKRDHRFRRGVMILKDVPVILSHDTITLRTTIRASQWWETYTSRT